MPRAHLIPASQSPPTGTDHRLCSNAWNGRHRSVCFSFIQPLNGIDVESVGSDCDQRRNKRIQEVGGWSAGGWKGGGGAKVVGTSCLPHVLRPLQEASFISMTPPLERKHKKVVGESVSEASSQEATQRLSCLHGVEDQRGGSHSPLF